MNQNGRLIVVSNRLPVTVRRDVNGEWIVERAMGGLVTALDPVLRARGGRWIGWPGDSDVANPHDLLQRENSAGAYELIPVNLTREDIDLYYHGFSNEILWPLFHDLILNCRFDPDYWPAYQSVNEAFAKVVAANSEPGDYIWIQDYHLTLVASYLRKMGLENRKIGFFLHIPFPPLEVFHRLPWQKEIMEGLLSFDLVGFQTTRDRRNFTHCVKSLARYPVRSRKGIAVGSVKTPERNVHFGAFPISIDFRGFERRAYDDDVEAELVTIRRDWPSHSLILGLDRLDYTKGIPHRLGAFGRMLRDYPDLRGKVSLIQVVIPSRTDVRKYQDLKNEIDRLVGSINGQFTQAGWTPIKYIFRSLTPTELLAFYRYCSVALITPLKDGMNLVSKEYCACRRDEQGVLVLSEFAGSAWQLGHDALLTNPFDIVRTAEAIRRALLMPAAEQRRRMRTMRGKIRRDDVERWVNSILAAATLSAGPNDEFVMTSKPGVDTV